MVAVRYFSITILTTILIHFLSPRSLSRSFSPSLFFTRSRAWLSLTFFVRIFSRDEIKKNDKGEKKVYARTRTRTPLDWSRKLISVQDMNDIQSMRQVGRQTVEEGSTFFFSLFFSFFLFFSVGQLPRRKRKTSSTCVVGLSFEIRWYGWSHARKPAKDLVPRWVKRSLSGRKNTTGQWLTANSKFDRFPELFFFFSLSTRVLELAFAVRSEQNKKKKASQAWNVFQVYVFFNETSSHLWFRCSKW